MTDEELAEIERVWAAAAEGPWCVCMDGARCWIGSDGGLTEVVAGHTGDVSDLVVSDDNATAIAAAPTHVARLLAEVKRLRAEVEDYEELRSNER